MGLVALVDDDNKAKACSVGKQLITEDSDYKAVSLKYLRA